MEGALSARTNYRGFRPTSTRPPCQPAAATAPFWGGTTGSRVRIYIRGTVPLPVAWAAASAIAADLIMQSKIGYISYILYNFEKTGTMNLSKEKFENDS
jgi:hypothetical protein